MPNNEDDPDRVSVDLEMIEMLKEQDAGVERWYWLTFTVPNGALAFAMVPGRSRAEALPIAARLGIHPAGDARLDVFNRSVVPDDLIVKYGERVLSMAERDAFDAELGVPN